MIWSSKVPTTPGVYWYRKYPEFKPTIVHIVNDNRLGLLQDGWQVWRSSNDGRASWCLVPLPCEIEYDTERAKSCRALNHQYCLEIAKRFPDIKYMSICGPESYIYWIFKQFDTILDNVRKCIVTNDLQGALDCIGDKNNHGDELDSTG